MFITAVYYDAIKLISNIFGVFLLFAGTVFLVMLLIYVNKYLYLHKYSLYDNFG